MIEKAVEHIFDFIKKLSRKTSLKIEISGHLLDGKKVSLKKEGMSFEIKAIIDGDMRFHGLSSVAIESNTSIKISSRTQQYYTTGKRFFFNSLKIDSKHGDFVLTGKTNGLSNIEKFEDMTPTYLRLVIPLKIAPDFDPFSSELAIVGAWQQEIVKIMLNGIEFHFYVIKNHHTSYFIIDTTDRLCFVDFEHCCYSITSTIGFLLGKYYSDEGYYISYEDTNMRDLKSFFYSSFKKSIHASYPIITINPYSVIDQSSLKISKKGFVLKGEKRRIMKGLKKISVQMLSVIAQKIYDLEEYRRAVHLYLEGNTLPLEIAIANYYVALEALTSTIAKSKDLKPFEDKELADELLKEIYETIDQFIIKNPSLTENREELRPIDIVKKRINNAIHSPTNTDKLSEPFDKLGYVLTPEEKKFIKERDRYLHGRLSKSINKKEESFKTFFHLALQLRFLISVFILKSCGYKGKIIFYPKKFEHITGIYTYKDVFKDI